MPNIIKFCAQHGVKCTKVTPLFDEEAGRLRAQSAEWGGREHALACKRRGCFAVLFYYMPKSVLRTQGDKGRGKRRYHSVLFYDGYLINNWSTARVVALDETHGKDTACARKAIAQTDLAIFRNMNIIIYDIYEYVKVQ